MLPTPQRENMPSNELTSRKANERADERARDGGRASEGVKSFGILIGKSAALLSELNSKWNGFSESHTETFRRSLRCVVAHLSLVCARLTADHTRSLIRFSSGFSSRSLWMQKRTNNTDDEVERIKNNNRLASLFGDKVLHAFRRNINKNWKLFLIEQMLVHARTCFAHVFICVRW